MCCLSELCLATTIVELTPVSCYYMVSFTYGDKKAKDVGLIVYSILAWKREWLRPFVSLGGGNCCLSWYRQNGDSLISLTDFLVPLLFVFFSLHTLNVFSTFAIILYFCCCYDYHYYHCFHHHLYQFFNPFLICFFFLLLTKQLTRNV